MEFMLLTIYLRKKNLVYETVHLNNVKMFIVWNGLNRRTLHGIQSGDNHSEIKPVENH